MAGFPRQMRNRPDPREALEDPAEEATETPKQEAAEVKAELKAKHKTKPKAKPPVAEDGPEMEMPPRATNLAMLARAMKKGK